MAEEFTNNLGYLAPDMGQSLGGYDDYVREQKAASEKAKTAGVTMFPNDLGEDHIPDYIVFYFTDLVNPDGKWTNNSLRYYGAGTDTNLSNTQLGQLQATQIKDLSKTLQSAAGAVGKVINTVQNTTASIAGGVANITGTTPIVNGSGKTNDQAASDTAAAVKSKLGLDTNYKRTGDVVGLMMPNAIQFNDGAGWQAVSAQPTGMGLLAKVVAGDSSISDIVAREGVGWLANVLVENGQAVAESVVKKTFNPYTSQAFESMQRRQFRFDWLLTPKNQTELDKIKDIIFKFRYYMYPSLDDTGTFLLYPGQIDIEYMVNGGRGQNEWLPKIATCVIKDFSTNYTPNNQWASVQASTPGAPYQVHISVTVEEIVPLVKKDIVGGM